MTFGDRTRKCMTCLKPRYIFAALAWAGNIAAFVLWVLMTYLTDVWGEKFTDAAAIVNVQDGLTAMMSISVAVLADAYFGRYWMVILSAAAYTLGLSLLTISAPPVLSNILGKCREQEPACIGKLQEALFYMALLLIAVGKAGQETTLDPLWVDQCSVHENQEVNNAQQCTNKDWSNIALGILTLGTIILSSIESWATRFGILVIFMALASLLFLCGTPSYVRVEPRGSPLTRVLRVFVAATLKRHLKYPPNASQLHEIQNPREGEVLLPHTNHLRCLDKAAIVDSTDPNTEQNKWRLCTMTEVEETKLLLSMLPMWTTFLICGLVLSTGDTYFLEQGNNMDSRLGNIKIPLPTLLLLFYASRLIANKLYDQILSNFTELEQRYSTRLRIGVGMLFSVLCCGIAALVETKRLNVVRKQRLLLESNARIPMSAFWLTPQFILLGAVEGLLQHGFEKFFYDQGPDSMKTYANPFTNSAIGMGTILSVLTVTATNKASKTRGKRSWFAADLNSSRLDYFYWTLAVLSFINLSLYTFISSRFTDKKRTVEQQFSRSVDVVRGQT